MNGRQIGRRMGAALLIVTMGVGLGSLPASGAAPAGMHGLGARRAHGPARASGAASWRTLPAGLASALRQNLSRDGASPHGTTWTQQAEFTPTAGSSFGSAVSISGTTALIAEQSLRTVYVYVNNGGTWSVQQALTSTAAGYGTAVALSGDTAVVGAPGYYGMGGVFVYVRSGSTWTLQALLRDPGGVARDQFGYSLALSSNGNTLVVGAAGSGVNPGAAYVYGRGGSGWARQATLKASDGIAYDLFGIAVALSGNTVLVAAPNKNGDAGAVYAFVRSTSAVTPTWSQQAEIAAPACCGRFGSALGLEGNTAVIGATSLVWAFVRSGTTWSEQMQLPTPPDAVGTFGTAISLSGGSALIGAESTNFNQGSAYIFVDSGGTWTEQAEMRATDGAGHNDFFDSAVGLSGNTALIGAHAHYPSGAAYVFVRS